MNLLNTNYILSVKEVMIYSNEDINTEFKRENTQPSVIYGTSIDKF